MGKSPFQVAKEISVAMSFNHLKWLKGLFWKSSDTYSGNPEGYLDTPITQIIDALPVCLLFLKLGQS